MTSATWRLQLLIWCVDLRQRGVLGVRLAGFLFLQLSPSGSEGFYERDAGWGQGALGSCCCVFQDLRKSCYKFRLCPKIWQKSKETTEIGQTAKETKPPPRYTQARCHLFPLSFCVLRWFLWGISPYSYGNMWEGRSNLNNSVGVCSHVILTEEVNTHHVHIINMNRYT